MSEPKGVGLSDRRFEDLPVWNDAMDLAASLLHHSRTGELNGLGDLKNQIGRAAISISNNMAEGFERGTNQELITFLYYARGSAGEVRSMRHLLRRVGPVTEVAGSVDGLLRRFENISRQLGAWIESLKNSDDKGTRFQNDRTRTATETERRREPFQVKIREAQEEAVRGWMDRSRRGKYPEDTGDQSQ